MSGATSAEDSALVRAALIGAATGFALVFGAYALAGHLWDRLCHRRATGHPVR